MNGADYTKARNAADELLKKYAVEEPLVPVFDIAQKEGLTIKAFRPSEKLEKIAGFFDFDTKTIFVNDNDPPNRKTFTVAHELAHYILRHKNEDIGILLRFPEMQTQNPTES
jgi:Zn-dependent peptidase ImmA (M78 family)